MNIPNGLMMFYETVRYSPYDTQSDHPRWAVPCITTQFALSPCTLVYSLTCAKTGAAQHKFQINQAETVCALKQWVISIMYIRPCIILNIWIQIIDVQASSFFYSSMGFSKVDTRSAGQQQQNPESEKSRKRSATSQCSRCRIGLKFGCEQFTLKMNHC